MSRVFKSRVNQAGRELSLNEFKAKEFPPEQIAARLRESEADRLAIADSFATVDQDLSALEDSRVVAACIRVDIDAGRVEVSNKNLDVQVAVDGNGLLIVRFGSSLTSPYSIHPWTQYTGQREIYFPIAKRADVFVLECRTNADAFVDLNVGTHAVSILIQR